MRDYFIGVDVGSSKVCAALGKADDDGSFQIIGVTSVRCNALSRGIVIDIDTAAAAIKECISKLEAITQMPTQNVILSFPGGLCDLSDTKGLVAITSESKKITEKDVKRVLDEAKKISVTDDNEIIGIIPKIYSIDGNVNVSNPIGMISKTLEVHGDIVLAKSKPIYNLLLSLERAGIIPDEVIMQPVAQTSLLGNNELRNCVALIDIGADIIDLGIYKGGNICYTNLIQLGGSNITSDISKCLDISVSDAEHIKIKYGEVKVDSECNNKATKINSAYDYLDLKDRETLVDIITARAEEILEFILAELKQSGYYNDIDVVVITGGGIAKFSQIDKLSSNILNKSVRIAVPEVDEILNTSNTTAISIIKNKFNSYNFKSVINSSSETIRDKQTSKKNNVKKFGTKIRELLDEFF